MERSQNIQSQIRFVRRLIMGVVGGCGIVILILLVFLPIDERINATGIVRAERDTYLFSPEDGILAGVVVHEGEEVKKGQAVLQLDDTTHQARLQQIEAEIKEAKATLAFQRAKLETTKKLPLPREFWHMDEDVGISREELRQKEVEYERSQELNQKGLISKQDLERSRLAVELAKAGAAKTHDKVEILDKGLEQTIMKEAQAQIQSAEAQLGTLEVERELCRQQIERCQIRSPEDGIVTLVLKRRQGQRVTRGEDIAHVSHGPATRVDLFAGETDMHRVRIGQRVVMKSRSFDALRNGYIEGRVVRVALEPERRDSAEASDPAYTYRVVAVIERTPEPLVLGSTIEGKVILQRIPLWKLLLPAGMRDSAPHPAVDQ